MVILTKLGEVSLNFVDTIFHVHFVNKSSLDGRGLYSNC